MVASRDYDDCVKAACEAGVDGIVSWAGVPRHLPELTKEFPGVALVPILSTERWVKMLIKNRQEKYWRNPDAIVMEDPSKAWGHLWAGDLEAVNDEGSKLKNSVPAVRAYLDSQNLQHIPIIAAWWISTRENIAKAFKLWASWVQMWTRFLASEESNANEQFKNAVVNAKKEDIGVIRSSAWLPFRTLKECGTLTREGGSKDRDAHIRSCLRRCLIHCWFTKWVAKVTQMCIVKELIRSTKWGGENWLMTTWDFFDDDWKSKITSILPVKEIMKTLIG
jgi:nitronate monooxygenase